MYVSASFNTRSLSSSPTPTTTPIHSYSLFWPRSSRAHERVIDIYAPHPRSPTPTPTHAHAHPRPRSRPCCDRVNVHAHVRFPSTHIPMHTPVRPRNATTLLLCSRCTAQGKVFHFLFQNHGTHPPCSDSLAVFKLWKHAICRLQLSEHADPSYTTNESKQLT